MRNASARGVKIDAMLAGECFDLRVLLEVLRRDILNVVINGEYRLRRIRDGRSADLFELWNYCAGVVMGHDMARPNRNKIARAHDRARSKSIRMTCGNLLNQRDP